MGHFTAKASQRQSGQLRDTLQFPNSRSMLIGEQGFYLMDMWGGFSMWGCFDCDDGKTPFAFVVPKENVRHVPRRHPHNPNRGRPVGRVVRTLSEDEERRVLAALAEGLDRIGLRHHLREKAEALNFWGPRIVRAWMSDPDRRDPLNRNGETIERVFKAALGAGPR